MLINEANGRIINSNSVYIHDDHLISMFFDRVSQKLTLMFQPFDKSNDQYSIQFIDVKSFQMTSCNFWGIDSARVLDWEYIESNKRELSAKLISQWENTTLFGREIPSYDDFLETKILFASGDILQIVCKEVLYKKNIEDGPPCPN